MLLVLTWGVDIMEDKYDKNAVKEMLDRLEQNKYVNSEKTLELGFEAYSLCKKENYEIGMAYALLRIGQEYKYMSEYEKAMPYLFDSINLSQKQGICDLQVIAYLNIGNVYLDIAEYEKSLDYYNSAEKIAKIITKSKNYYKDASYELYAAKIYNNIGEIYRIIGCYEDAITYYELSKNIDENFSYRATLGTVLSNLGYVEYHLGHYEKALEYLNEGLKHLKKHDYKIAIVETYEIFALIHEREGRHQECKSYFNKAIEICSKMNYEYNKINLLLDYSNFLGNMGEKEAAIDKLDEIYNISINKKMYAKTLEICKIAIRLYEKADDVDSANKYYKLYFENEKKLEHLETEARAKNLKTKIKLDKMEKENKSILEKSESFRRKAEDLTEVIKNMSIISELGEKITTTLDLNQIYEMLYNTINVFIKASFFGVSIYSEETRKIHYHYAVENGNKIVMDDVSIDNESSMAAKCLRDKKIIVINDMLNEYSNYLGDNHYITANENCLVLNSVVFCPLVIDNNLIGVMTIQCFEKDSFTMLTVEMIKALSSYAAIAINNAIKSMNLLVEVKQRRRIQEQLERINEKLIYLSENDGLTNIPNRRKFDAVIKKEWDKAKQEKNTISIIMFDIDFFKQYNDNYGHTNGDECLISVCNELRKSLVGNHFAARFGGDEFAIILPDTDLEEAINFAESFRSSVEGLAIRHSFSKISDRVTVTLGVSSALPDEQVTIMEFIRQADVALYEAKNRGRNQVIGKCLALKHQSYNA